MGSGRFHDHIVGLGLGSLIWERKLDAKKKVDSLAKAKKQ